MLIKFLKLVFIDNNKMNNQYKNTMNNNMNNNFKINYTFKWEDTMKLFS